MSSGTPEPEPTAITPEPLGGSGSSTAITTGPSALDRKPAPRFSRLGAVLAWIVIAATVLVIPLWRWWFQPAAVAVAQEGLDLVLFRMQGRCVVGLASLFSTSTKQSASYNQVKTLNQGPFEQRLRFVVLAGELAGPAEARQQLRHLAEFQEEGKLKPPPAEAALPALLDRLYRGYEKDLRQDQPPRPESALSGSEQATLRQQLGWFGDLALAPEGSPDTQARAAVLAPARRAALGIILYGSLALVVALFGVYLLGALGVFWLSGRLHGGLETGSRHGGVYAETFALYMVLFLVLSLAASLVPHGGSRWLLSTLVVLGSLAALVWPVWRGVPWAVVRQDIGWKAGRRPLLELLLGPGCYACALPLAFAGLIVTLLLTQLHKTLGGGPPEFGPSGAPTHPILEAATEPGWWIWVQVLLVASVAAPIVEETMFRGVFYRHLREATAWAGRVPSVLASAVLVSFLFAAIHPQGLLFAPVLMGLAFAFALFREWRGTLVPTMIAHALNNAAATFMLWLVAR